MFTEVTFLSENVLSPRQPKIGELKMMGDNGQECDCSASENRDRAAMEQLLIGRHCHQRTTSGYGTAINSTRSSTRSSREELRDENLWLVQQLAISECQTRHLQERVHQLRRHVRALEEQHANEKTRWRKEVESRQLKWTDEYDRHMQSLLQIVAHHETNQKAMQHEIEALRSQNERVCEPIKSIPIVREQATQTKTENQDDYTGSCDHPSSEIAEATVQTTKLVELQPYTHEDSEVLEAEPSIHEHYVSLTMQKLLEQLRHSNSATESLPTTCSPTAGDLTTPFHRASSFRDAIHKRLGSSSAATSSPLTGPYPPTPHLSRDKRTRAAPTASNALLFKSFALSPIHEAEAEAEASRRSAPHSLFQPAA